MGKARESSGARLRHFGRAMADLLWPPACIGCGAAVIEPDHLCPVCWRAMPFVTPPVCMRYGTPLPFDLGADAVSPVAISDPPVFDRARSVARYDGLARELVHRLKYGDRTELARPMGRLMAEAGGELLETATLLVPVPLHRFRFWGRRFNQAALLAAEIGKSKKLPVGFESLKRVRATRPQVGLTRAERADNLARALTVPAQERLRVAGQRVVLIDDVMTTASTGNAASRALLKAGAASVDLLVFAVVAKS